MSELLHAGRVGRPHGLDGSFHVVQATPALLILGSSLHVAGRETEVVRRAGTDERPILRLTLAADRDAIEALRGEELLAPREAAPELEDGEFWAQDLEGCTVMTGERDLGTVAALIALPSCEALELESGLLVPMVADAVKRIDVAARRIEVDAAFLALDRLEDGPRHQDAGPDA
ncbi:MAG: 16S rRNA processing protein RimM [Solirubrobacterales bacterium]|nr:16S rRNA processing protein RimM [Solirubrobacterales bacterium]